MLISSSRHLIHLSTSSIDGVQINKKLKKGKDSLNQNNTIQKNNDPLKILKEQKQNIMDNKQKYLDEALKRNESSASIKEKLKEFDKQIADIEKQINQLKQEKDKLNPAENEKDKKHVKHKSNSKNGQKSSSPELDHGNEMMDNLLKASNSLSDAKTISNEKTSESGEKVILKYEINQAIAMGHDPVHKKERLAKIEDNIANLNKNISDKINDAVDQVDSSRNSTEEKSINNNSEEDKDTRTSSSSTNDNVPENIDDIKTSINRTIIKNYKNNAYNRENKNGKEVNFVA